jgi:hypothetical protein
MESHYLDGDRAVQHLSPLGSGEIVLTADTVVLCVHRGRNRLDAEGRLVRQAGQPKRRGDDPDQEPGVRMERIAYEGDYCDTYDSKHYIIGPGYFTTTLGCALHFKARAVVPGSRNPDTNSETSFLAILGVATPHAGGQKIVKRVDDVEEWEPFNDDECAEYGMAVEALDRRHMVDPIVTAAELQVVDTTAALAGGKEPVRKSRVSGGGNSGGRASGAGKGGKATRIEVTDNGILDPVDARDHAALREMASDAVAAASETGRG